MTSENKTNYALIFTILVTLAGWAVTFGVCQQTTETNGSDIQRIEKQPAKQCATKSMNYRQSLKH